MSWGDLEEVEALFAAIHTAGWLSNWSRSMRPAESPP
jgi:hypothetical protein